MGDTILFVDYENVQALDLAAVPTDGRVVLVLGANQTKLPAELAIQAQSFMCRLRSSSRTASTSASRSLSR